MAITLYTAPDCIRCRVVKNFLADRNLAYETIDFQAQKDEFNAFYRKNRPSIYRNPEGVEFPLFSDGETVKQGSGEIIAYLLSGKTMEQCVTRSDLLHGWISGLYPSRCPAGQEGNFLVLVRYLAEGGLKVCIRSDGRNPALLKSLLESGHVGKVSLDVPGPAAVYSASEGGPLSMEALAESIALVGGFKNGEIRILVSPIPREDGTFSWTCKEEAAQAAAMLAEASGNRQLPVVIAVAADDVHGGLHGLEAFDRSRLLPFRSACREHLFKVDVARVADF